MNPEMAKRAEEAARAKGYSPEEINMIINHAKIMCSLPIKNYLLWLVEEEIKENSDTLNELKMMIEQIPTADKTGSQTIEIPFNNQKFVIVFQTAIVKKDHKFDIMIPDLGKKKEESLTKKIFETIDRHAEMINTYYKQMMIDNRRIYLALSSAIKTVDFNTLKINEINRSLAFHEKYDKRLGVVLFYVDGNGNPLFEEIPELVPEAKS